MRRIACLIALVPAFALANECKFTAQHDFDVDPAGLKSVAFALGSSDVRVEGVPGLARIEVRGKACASEQDSLSGLDVQQQRTGDRLTITPRQDRNNHWSWFHSSYAYVDLTVRMPAALVVDIHGSSADADVRGVAALEFDTSSGDLVVDSITGALTVSTSSGDVRGGEVGGVDVRTTSSGDITLHDVRGEVKVARSGSGDLSFDNVAGSVNIGSVGSGDVSARHVDHDVTVDSIGSGDVSVSTVGGNFSVHSIGSGDISQREVRGTVSVPRDD